MSLQAKKFKRPESVLVVVYTRTGKVLLLKRADDPDFWQSVTGSLLWEETEPRQAAARELHIKLRKPPEKTTGEAAGVPADEKV